MSSSPPSASGPPFSKTVKPFFTECYKEHMSFMLDLWNPSDVCTNYAGIRDAVVSGRMPPPADQGCEGEWNPEQRSKFLSAFDAWYKGGCNPA